MRITLFFFFVLIISGCKTDLQNTKIEKNNISSNIEMANNVTIRYSERGKNQAILKAPIMMRELDSINRTMFTQGMNLKIYDSVGNLSNTLTSKYGELDHQTNQMKAKDSVKVVNAKGETLTTKELIWMQNERKLYTYGSVALRTEKEVIYGDTLIADEAFRTYTIKKVKGIIQIKK